MSELGITVLSHRPSAETEIRDYYDPAGKQVEKPLDEFLHGVAATRTPSFLHGVGAIAGHEVILAENLHCLIAGSEIASYFTQNEYDRIAEGIEASAMRTASAARWGTEHLGQQREDRITKLKIPFPELPSSVITDGQVMAAVGHANVFRRNGRGYFSHPAAIAAGTRVAWRKQHIDLPQELYDIINYLDFTHDVPEDNIDRHGEFVGNVMPLSPLAAKYMLEHRGIKDAYNAALTLYYLMRTRAVDDSRMPYVQYGERGIDQPGTVGLYYDLTKGGDVYNNSKIDPERIDAADPKADEKYQKRADYQTVLTLVLQAIEKYGSEAAQLLHTMTAVTRSEVNDEQARIYTFNVESIARSVVNHAHHQLAA